jgi:phosphoglycolate phosphatase
MKQPPARRDAPAGSGPGQIRGVLLDWDGTLLDSYQADVHAYEKMFAALGIRWSLAHLHRHYSPNWHRIYRAVRLPRRRWEEADRLWARFYREQSSALLPSARRVLRALARRYALGLVTSGNRRRVLHQLRQFGLTRLFAARVCSEDAARRKPHPAPLRLALERLRLRPKECVYVGDAPEDVEMARRAGMRVVAVLGSFPTHRRVRALAPDAVIRSVAALPRALARLR